MADPQDALDALAPDAPTDPVAPSTADAASAAAAAAGDSPDLATQLAAAEAKAADAHDQFLRARAEMANIQRRADDAVAKAHKFAVEDFARELLAVRDSLEAALATQSGPADATYEGVQITLKQLTAVFDKFAVREVAPAVGEKLDPNRHQAMAAVPSEQPPNTVVQVFQKGYTLHERLLRPALVAAAKAPDA
ncbi:MAG: nucleotide exchange factor GrpE [Burkholderiales bacterium]|jgi:molecular chaperone GrpE|nr:nucleotide exchange factor GrpE [Burkholderiales bacterium]